MTKIAWIFPGQGSQAVGMGVDLQEIKSAIAKLEQAEKILGWSVLEKCLGDEEQLSQTLYTQPCLFVIESILTDILVENGHLPDLVAGHSLGEYSALYAARVFDFETGLKLVKKRSELMDQAAGGKMAAVMKFDRQKLESVIDNTPDLVIANDNSSEQVVISGTPEAVEKALEQITAKRIVTLKVSGAFHSPLMQDAAEQFQQILDSVTFNNAKVPILSNIDPTSTTDAQTIKTRLIQQMTGSVRWREIMLQLPNENITQVIEVGPGKVLTGLVKRTCPEIALKNVATSADITG
ncbi:[acyl-carrier-protein] S-malonyltransferase [Aphanothece hegewaldii CCALA 016]|uniref:Malonyl CoA-acyl carrier protein transacylase n=1 Tax=Aphanothece hegewaldii CCALA 016 TaxID=2107694 RepID=A0A2T1M2H3_9CHRO|nr:ACP S-malonyltransferase [Aphanothece hegewaldii]PSF38932.1 [acyl-carrier-protein] S-malonyltransferase [Aphanothece hegewaldii CCALA 016]